MEARIDKFNESVSEKLEEMTEIMKNFLQLNPYFRMTAYECIMKCSIFDGYRLPAIEKVLKKLYNMQQKDKAGKNN